MAKRYFRDRHGVPDTLERLSEMVDFCGDRNDTRIHMMAVSRRQRLEDATLAFDKAHRSAMDLINEAWHAGMRLEVDES